MTSSPRLDVLHVLEATLGGTRQYLDDLVAAQRLLPWSSGLVHATRRADEAFEGTLERVRDAGWRTAIVEMDRAVRPLADLGAALRLRGILRRWRPRVLHCHSSKAGGVGRLAVVGFTPRPLVVYSPHALAANVAKRYLAVERLLARGTDRFAAISESERAEIAGFGVAPRDRIDVISPVIDSARYKPRERQAARRGLGLGSGPIVLGIGRFIEQKHPEAFLHAIAALRQQRSDVRGIWIGEGELQPRFERVRRELGLDDVVTVEGWKVDVRDWIAAADVVLSVARFESFGYVVAEALAMERPVVASQVTGTVDVVQGAAIELLYPPGDVAAAAQRLSAVLDDPERGARWARAGAVEVRRLFSPESMARSLAGAYGSATGDVSRVAGSSIA